MFQKDKKVAGPESRVEPLLIFPNGLEPKENGAGYGGSLNLISSNGCISGFLKVLKNEPLFIWTKCNDTALQTEIKNKNYTSIKIML